jgi:hypothetical protein
MSLPSARPLIPEQRSVTEEGGLALPRRRASGAGQIVTSRSMGQARTRNRELYISLGCALENLPVAAEHFGFRHGISYFPEPGNEELAATVMLPPPGGVPSHARAGATLSAVIRRHNDNSGFRSTPVPEQLRLRLLACGVEPDLRVHLTDDRHFRRWIDALTLEADRVEFANPAFRRVHAEATDRGCGGMTSEM